MLYALSLGGDGDEVDAIHRVEERLQVKLDYSDAPNWATAGDLFRSVVRARPEVGDDDTNRREMAAALCEETGDDPGKVAPETLLIDDRSLFAQARDWLRGKRKAG